ncbi:HAD-IA family hydrolase [Pontixanthobacter aestiaquae]|uniref:HAD-IA family hydrolase n=1 Tax=Pontixanthobacter aestiaquae TaxID=1509367 RepID=A0A844Z7M5_9SPHN|nr:HAD-IA family hydrolase [Pontixanthobacter aestiaquae]MDN3646105.1 HAD-IA family hydrolase [Pontixanthobacter aestiaquae]MXO82903.1 HAD-IA family hydrolase [Pontixanthobacter aestiaquae]
MTVKLAVFDCDGTLVDGQASICEAMESAFTLADLPAPDRHDIRRIVGLSLPQAMRHLAPHASDAQRAAAVEGYKEAFRTSRMQGRVQEPLFTGIVAVLNRLRDGGWTLAVATGKSDRGLFSCLATHGLNDHFISLQTADRHPSKPHPAMLEAAMSDALAEPENTVMIGDTTFDMDMAAAARVRGIGVDWGYHTPEELTASGAAHIATTPQQLGSILL